MKFSIFFDEIIIKMKLFAFARFEANILKSIFFSFWILFTANTVIWPNYCHQRRKKQSSICYFQFQCHLIKNSTPHRINFSILSSNNLVKFSFEKQKMSNTVKQFRMEIFRALKGIYIYYKTKMYSTMSSIDECAIAKQNFCLFSF